MRVELSDKEVGQLKEALTKYAKFDSHCALTLLKLILENNKQRHVFPVTIDMRELTKENDFRELVAKLKQRAKTEKKKRKIMADMAKRTGKEIAESWKTAEEALKYAQSHSNKDTYQKIKRVSDAVISSEVD